MRTAAASHPSDASRDNEDWVLASQDLAIVLDGATARTETGCVHGVAWYSARLGGAIAALAADQSTSLQDTFARAIAEVAALHPQCDLAHDGTPSAAVGIMRSANDRLEYLSLGDITLLFDLGGSPVVVCDDRVSMTAIAERREADRFPIGSAEKQAAMEIMKRAELAARNRPGGFFVAASNPAVATESLTGKFELGSIHRAAILTDGTARAVDLFGLVDWSGLLNELSTAGPNALIERVRQVESSDPLGERWPRNKKSDDATAVLIS